MKKNLSIIFFALIGGIIILSSMIFGMYQSVFCVGMEHDNITVYVESSVNSPSKNDFYNQIKATADSINTNVYKIEYPYVKPGEKTKVVLYSYIENTDDFYKNFPLREGRYLNKEDSDDLYMSSQPSSDPNCIGVLQWFDSGTVLEIRPITANSNDLMYGAFNLKTGDKDKANQFINILANQPSRISATISTQVKQIMVSSVLTKIILYYVTAFVIFSLAVSSVIVFIYNLVLSYKEFAVKKLFGFSNKKLIGSCFKYTAMSLLAAWALSYAIYIIYSLIKNGLSFFVPYSLIVSSIILAVSLILLITIAICSVIFIKKINIGHMLKNKKPYRLIRALNGISKVVLSIASIVVLTLLLQNLNVVLNQNQDAKKWDFTKEYAYLQLDLSDPDDDAQYYGFQNKCKEFFTITNSQGGVLMDVSDVLLHPEKKDKFYKDDPMWDSTVNGVDINNNYLKINPIYDVNGNRVLLEDENALNYTVLIPEKYQKYNQQIVEYYTKQKDFSLSGFKHYKPVSNSKYNKPTDLNLNIIYVKDNQTYFSVNPTIGNEHNFEFTDPVAVVYNEANIPPGSAGAFITQGFYYAKIDNPNNPAASLQGSLKQSGLDEHLIAAPSLYNYVATEFYNNTKLAGFYITLAVISLAMFVIIILVSTINYMNENKLILAVEKIHGFSFISRHILTYIKSLIMWGLFFTVASIFFSSYHAQYITLALAAIDVLLRTITIKLKEINNTKDVLKGE